jgi:methyl-accepting chemotaxis protein
MAEQAGAAAQITTAAASMRQQTEETAGALKEQARTMRAMLGAAQNASAQVGQITRATREHAAGSESVLRSLQEVRGADRVRRGVAAAGGSGRASNGVRKAASANGSKRGPRAS